MRTVLLIDDEQRMLDLIELFLIPHGFRCIKETNGKEALDTLKNENVSLVLLDIMMPEMDGWEVCEKIREFSDVPVIMLTARSDKLDLVKGLDSGADDYITKPFDERELLARVNAMLRRFPDEEEKTEMVMHGDFKLDKETYSLHFRELKVPLTLKEFYIIEALLSRPTKTYTREQLLNAAWDYNTYTDIRTVDSHIRNLRDKLKTAGFPIDEFLKTVWGIGYKWG
ncbi:response regulator transcription factor [Sporosarcina pasteurii]|uniref:Staphylococcal respiratory response protein A n=1 Tax=Sporosarcina pasteurii TaxID=1474 RepID=A0A380BLX9_SPOPA|nr:response regulator transcription factor [Sporosarcina pasteurii]MDS9470873.1 response regulator transcription factor [Sporosarcina pasteurii]QBQ05464.1 response regulator transcription factor [Sporosarcina pasteurii]SUJ03092.1 Staphylococcal respiratory response protein A [Sporosarcina pasteurii]